MPTNIVKKRNSSKKNVYKKNGNKKNSSKKNVSKKRTRKMSGGGNLLNLSGVKPDLSVKPELSVKKGNLVNEEYGFPNLSLKDLREIYSQNFLPYTTSNSKQKGIKRYNTITQRQVPLNSFTKYSLLSLAKLKALNPDVYDPILLEGQYNKNFMKKRVDREYKNLKQQRRRQLNERFTNHETLEGFSNINEATKLPEDTNNMYFENGTSYGFSDESPYGFSSFRGGYRKNNKKNTKKTKQNKLTQIKTQNNYHY